MSTTPVTPSDSNALPLVVQVGFAGSRNLPVPAGMSAAQFERELVDQLYGHLKGLRKDLGLSDRYFFCGISQIAIGADTIFTLACEKLSAEGWVQRIFLPQHLDAYLDATSNSKRDPADPSKFLADFSPDQKQRAKELMGMPHIIQERLVSDAHDRHARFHDANLEIVRVSNVIVCLTADDGKGEAGGTREMIDLAKKRIGLDKERDLPVLVLRMVTQDGAVRLLESWDEGGKELFRKPSLPSEFTGMKIQNSSMPPDVNEYSRTLKDFSSQQADLQAFAFKFAALTIIGAHVVATVLALFALGEAGKITLPTLLIAELVFLGGGFLVHHYLHNSDSLGRWALARLAAEVARSISSFGKLHVYPDHLLKLPMPDELRPILRTLSVLHLRSTRNHDQKAWEAMRDTYCDKVRLTGNKNAQMSYHERTRDEAALKLRWARLAFAAFSIGAFSATTLKLLVHFHVFPFYDMLYPIKAVLGPLAIILPVLAVAALSLAGALDWEAREHISDEMLKFLDRQKKLLGGATTSREYAHLLLETESRLLAETANWYARRTFLGVS